MSETQSWNKWIKLLPGEDIPSTQRNHSSIGFGYCTGWPLLTLKTPGSGLIVQFGCSTRYALAYMHIPTMLENPKGWKSEYRGDDLPPKGLYLVTLQKMRNGREFVILDNAYYDGERWDRWTDSWTVFGFRKYPKPYMEK